MEEVLCPVLVLTCKRTLISMKNILTQVEVKRMMVSCDGTFKFDCGGGVLITLGVVIVIVSKNGSVRRPYNWLYVFTQTENRYAASKGAEWLVKIPALFFGLEDFKWPVHCIDHAWCFHNSLTQNGGARTVTCVVHVKESVKRKKLEGLRVAVLKDVQMNHECAITDEMISMMTELLVKDWENRGLKKFAETFKRQYGSTPFNRYYHCASLIPGAKPNQNPTEGTNNALKVLVRELYQTMAGFLSSSMVQISNQCPGVSENDVSTRCNAAMWHTPYRPNVIRNPLHCFVIVLTSSLKTRSDVAVGDTKKGAFPDANR